MHYTFDGNGWPTGRFSGPQPFETIHAPAQPSPHHRWDGEAWVEDASSKAAALIAAYKAAIEAHVEATARERDYTSAVSLASYTGSTVAKWAAEASAFVRWRDAVWQYAFAELGKAQSGEREQPTVEAFITKLPDIKWPT